MMSKKTRSAMKRIAPAAVVAFGLVLGTAGSAFAVEILTIPISEVHRGTAGETILIKSIPVPSEWVGLPCDVIGETFNQRSVHVGNNLTVVTGDESFVIENFEDEGDIVHSVEEIDTLGASIQISLTFGEDGASSGGFRFVIDCERALATTTTTESTSTTVAPSTSATTAPATTVGPTTVPGSSTSEVPPLAPTIATEPTTSTTATPAAPTTAPPPAGPGAQPTLPVTGAETLPILLIGMWLAAAGTALSLFVRSRTL